MAEQSASEAPKGGSAEHEKNLQQARQRSVCCQHYLRLRSSCHDRVGSAGQIRAESFADGHRRGHGLSDDLALYAWRVQRVL